MFSPKDLLLLSLFIERQYRDLIFSEEYTMMKRLGVHSLNLIYLALWSLVELKDGFTRVRWILHCFRDFMSVQMTLFSCLRPKRQLFPEHFAVYSHMA